MHFYKKRFYKLSLFFSRSSFPPWPGVINATSTWFLHAGQGWYCFVTVALSVYFSYYNVLFSATVAFSSYFHIYLFWNLNWKWECPRIACSCTVMYLSRPMIIYIGIAKKALQDLETRINVLIRKLLSHKLSRKILFCSFLRKWWFAPSTWVSPLRETMTVCQISVGKKQQKKTTKKKKTNKKKKKNKQKKNSKPINFHTGWKNQQQGRQNKRISTKKKNEKAKKEGLTMRLPILSYNQADLSKLCGQIVFKR